MRDVYIVKVARLPFVSVKVGVLQTKFHEAAKRIREIDIPKLEAESGLRIKAELPPNASLYSGIPAQDLALILLQELFRDFPVGPEFVDVFRMGSVISHKTEEENLHAFAKVIGLRIGMARANTFTLDKACSSALMAIGDAYKAIKYGDADFAVAGGVEKMSDVPDRLVRFGLTNPFDGRLMAALADETSKEWGLTREELDDYSFESCERARAWQGKHEFIVPVETKSRTIVELDEEVDRRTINRKVFARAPLYPQYAEMENSPKCEITSVANSAQYADGGGISFLASGRMVRKYNLPKLAKVKAFAEASGPEPKNFILRPEEAIQKVLDSEGLMWTDIGHIEDNEAFAAGPKLLMKIRSIERERMNRRGGAIAHGHAIGGTTGMLVAKAIDIMQSDKEKYGIVTACNAVDEAPAILLENPYA